VLVSALELPSVADFVSIANRRHQLRALFVRDVIDARWLPQLFERAGLRTLRNTLVHSDATVPRRVLAAWLHGAQGELIAEARVADDRLFVVSCALEPYEIEFAKMPSLRSIPEGERSAFEVDEDGSYIHWPASDVHVDIDAIRDALEPRSRMRAVAARASRDRRYGAAIARLRTSRGLKQSDVAGLSERQVRRIEKGEGTTYESLQLLAKAHRMNIDDYLREVADVHANASQEDDERKAVVAQ
jgi:hypothetical protein